MSYTIYGRHSKATIIRDKQDYNKLYVNIVLHSRLYLDFLIFFIEHLLHMIIEAMVMLPFQI